MPRARRMTRCIPTEAQKAFYDAAGKYVTHRFGAFRVWQLYRHAAATGLGEAVGHMGAVVEGPVGITGPVYDDQVAAAQAAEKLWRESLGGCFPLPDH